MAESRREKILQDLETTLLKITIANGYGHEIGTVERGHLNPLDLQAYPVALILPLTDLPEAGASSVSRRVLTLALRLWVRPHRQLSEALEAFITDVVRTVMADTRRNGQAENTEEGETNYLYLDSQEVEAGADVEVRVTYRTRIDDLTALPS